MQTSQYAILLTAVAIASCRSHIMVRMPSRLCAVYLTLKVTYVGVNSTACYLLLCGSHCLVSVLAHYSCNMAGFFSDKESQSSWHCFNLYCTAAQFTNSCLAFTTNLMRTANRTTVSSSRHMFATILTYSKAVIFAVLDIDTLPYIEM